MPTNGKSCEYTMNGGRRKWIEKAENCEQSRDFIGAIEAYRQALRTEGSSYRLHARLGYCYEKTGDVSAAIGALDAATNFEACPPPWHMRLARLLVAQGEVKRANEKYKQSWQHGPSGRLALELGASGWEPWLADVAADGTDALAHSSIRELESALEDHTSEEKLTDLIERLGASKQSAAFWLYLYARLIRSGHAVAALISKRRAARRVIETGDNPQSIAELETAVAAACYVEEYGIADGLLKKSGWSAKDTLHIQLDVLISQGFVKEARALAARVGIAPTNERFCDYLQDKSIAIVGPAKNNLRNGNVIDQHDVVVRTNFTGVDPLMANTEMLGRRIDVSYYNTSFIELHEMETVTALRSGDVTWATMRHGSMRRRMKTLVPDQRYRDWISYKKPEFIGISFAMRHILYEMAVFANTPVSVYGADFFLGTDAHYSGYLGAGIAVTYEYARHDPFDAFFLMKTLWNAGVIKPDEVLGEFLSLGPEQFAARISERFSNVALS